MSWRQLPQSSCANQALGVRRLGWWFIAVTLGVLPFASMVVSGDEVAAQTSVPAVLSCSGGMVLDRGSGRCLTERTVTVNRPTWCPSGSTMVSGRYGGYECQTRVTTTRRTGRTRRVYSHTTYDKVWVPTGTKRVRTGTKRTWIKPSTMMEPLVPPVRVKTGSKRRCDFDPISGIWFNCRYVPVYKWISTHTTTVPGHWVSKPVYSNVDTGYWDRIANRHYTYEPIYETVVSWRTTRVIQGRCSYGWRTVGSRCQRTVLGQPSSPAHQHCPAGTTPSYPDAVGGYSSSVLLCYTAPPGGDRDTGDDHDDDGGGGSSRDGDARELSRLAGESDERLAELGIHRCAGGLLSYVACSKMPGRTWNSNPDVCEGIDGVTYRPDHGGSCVTSSDLLNKCTRPGDCEKTTVRTYCPAIGQLATTQIQEHVHPTRGPETYRVCIFDCANFSGLPSYVRTRIQGSYDYACLPNDEPKVTTPRTTTSTTSTTSNTTTTSTTSTTTTSRPGSATSTTAAHREPTRTTTSTTAPGGSRDPVDEAVPTTTVAPPRGTPPRTSTTLPLTGTTLPPTGIPLPPLEECPHVPPDSVAARALGGLGLGSNVRAASAGSSPQRHLPGGGRYLQVAPGRGWIEIRGLVDVGTPECEWTATWVSASWSDQRPWHDAELKAMETGTQTQHLVQRWNLLSEQQRQLQQRWHRQGAIPEVVVCEVGDAVGSSASTSCGWVLTRAAAYAWQVSLCFELDLPDEAEDSTLHADNLPSIRPSTDDPCWMKLASGVDWIRSVGDHADGRVSTNPSGSGS